jgi:serine/threonine protein kinase
MFSAHDSVTGNEVVLKFYNPDRRSATDAYRWECFEREARILARLNAQPGIIQLISGHDEFIESIPTSVGLSLEIPFAYYGLEKAQNDVASQIANHTWSAKETIDVFGQMCRAVQRIHQQELVHRDLKPDNFLVMESGEIKLSDFGTARFLDGSEGPLLHTYDRLPGDMRYTAPEIFAGLHDVDPRFAFRGDFFSLGAIVFEMFTGAQLGVQVFGPDLLTSFAVHMMAVPRGDRRRVYEEIVSDISSANPLPSLRSYSPLIPPSIRDRIDQLYKSLCHFDYRQRNCDFKSIFRQIDTCRLILHNEKKYQLWREAKRKRREAALAKLKGGRS